MAGLTPRRLAPLPAYEAWYASLTVSPDEEDASRREAERAVAERLTAAAFFSERGVPVSLATRAPAQTGEPR